MFHLMSHFVHSFTCIMYNVQILSHFCTFLELYKRFQENMYLNLHNFYWKQNFPSAFFQIELFFSKNFYQNYKKKRKVNTNIYKSEIIFNCIMYYYYQRECINFRFPKHGIRKQKIHITNYNRLFVFIQAENLGNNICTLIISIGLFWIFTAFFLRSTIYLYFNPKYTEKLYIYLKIFTLGNLLVQAKQSYVSKKMDCNL